MREIAHQNVYSASFLGSSNAPQPRPPNRFSHTIRQTTWFRARMCLIGVRNKILTFKPSYSRKTAILGPVLTGLIYLPLWFNQFFVDTMLEINYQWSSRCTTHTYTTGWPCFLYRRSKSLEQSPSLTPTNCFRRCFQKTTEDLPF